MSDLPLHEVPLIPVDGLTGTHHVTTRPGNGEPAFVIFPPGEDDAIELTREQLWQHIDALLTLLKRTPIPTTLEAS